MRWVVTVLCVLGMSSLHAEIKTEVVEYKDGDVTLQGFVAWNSDKTDASPGVLVVHQWTGLTDYEKGRCRQLAELGYVAFAADIYGKGIRPESMQDAAAKSGIYKNDRKLYRRRLNLGLDQLKARPGVAANQLGAIGYCFGGTGVLELARSGAKVAGVVSFHGGLDSPEPEAGQNIKCSILVCHGADDPFVPAADIDAFKAELNAANVDWQMDIYSGAVHSFTQPMAGNDNSRGAAYNKKADLRSWSAMKSFFDEVLQ
ncbi:MAG: dienelactone hydrolase family protein [Planctomycetaceae bacterium]|nr:dienelactone hydrolase family protein [Planctomycetaceae bacterium]